MMQFSEDPQIAENQMHAIIFYLTAFGYIDGNFATSEKVFVREFIKKLVQLRVHSALHDADPAMRKDLVEEYSNHFLEVFEKIDKNVLSWFTEVVYNEDDLNSFVYSKLKLRAFELFKSFDEENQRELLETAHTLIMADGVAHPSELQFRDEVMALLKSEIPLAESDLHEIQPAQVEVAEGGDKPQPRVQNHPLFERLEHHYSSNPSVLKQQAEADRSLIEQTMSTWDGQRRGNNGKLEGRQNISEFEGQTPFLDGHVYVHPLQMGREYELIVLGDLHGCYSCLKAAILQSDFFAKVQAFKNDPVRNPEPKLVLLGDYIDRGIYSYNGILRTVMQIFVTAPEHVYMLRGNHEYYLEYKGKIFGGVKPAEAINTLESYLPRDMFEAYMNLFESMPNMLLFDKFMFVHAGIPRDEKIAQWQDLSFLNDPETRFQMMWSDPGDTDFIPADLQKTSRFPFGRMQFRSFMARVGTTALVRGHEKIEEGFKKVYDDGVVMLLNLFSAGGLNNADLPPRSNYRGVTPQALTIYFKEGKATVTPWVIDYAKYQDPALNAFLKAPPEIQFKAD